MNRTHNHLVRKRAPNYFGNLLSKGLSKSKPPLNTVKFMPLFNVMYSVSSNAVLSLLAGLNIGFQV